MLGTFSKTNASARDSSTNRQNSRTSDRRRSGRALIGCVGRLAFSPRALALRYRASSPGSVQYEAFENGWHGAPPMTRRGSRLDRPANSLNWAPSSSAMSASSTLPLWCLGFSLSVWHATGSRSTSKRTLAPADSAPRLSPPAPAKRSTAGTIRLIPPLSEVKIMVRRLLKALAYPHLMYIAPRRTLTYWDQQAKDPLQSSRV
jgi:hypothetical protein